MNCYIVSYDIPDDRRRTRVADLLEDYGHRVQHSVFEVWVDDRLHKTMVARLGEVMLAEEDSILLYRLCTACQDKVTVMGQGEMPVPPGLLVI